MAFDLQVFLGSLFSIEFATGAVIALIVTAISGTIAVLLGIVLAVARMSQFGSLRKFAIVYIYIGRAIPTLLWLLLVWNALPQIMPALKAEWFSPFVAAVVALSLSEAAYMGEIIRGGLISVDPGQKEAGRTLGMKPPQIFFKITWPQAVRVFLPTATNEMISLLKLTSLASVISLQELLTVAGHKISATYRFAEIYAAAAIWYLIIVSVLMLIQNWLENRMRWHSSPSPHRRISLRRKKALRVDGPSPRSKV